VVKRPEYANFSHSQDVKEEPSSISNTTSNTEAISNETILDDISIKTKKLATGMTLLVESIDVTAKARGVILERTEDATKRNESIVKRAEHFLRSLENPGRFATYTAAGIALGYTVYSIFRYGQLPFAGLLGGIGSAAASNALTIHFTKYSTND
jgi:hypothetical protein